MKKKCNVKKKCKHKNWATDFEMVGVYSMWRKLCRDCGHHLSLGPSRDTPEALVELRAVEIADDVDAVARMMHGAIDHEVLGWIFACQAERGFALDKTCRNGSQSAGYLARVIWNA